MKRDLKADLEFVKCDRGAGSKSLYALLRLGRDSGADTRGVKQ